MSWPTLSLPLQVLDFAAEATEVKSILEKRLAEMERKAAKMQASRHSPSPKRRCPCAEGLGLC